jgi:RimJ/RimL family protein N-acetyltransferase
MQPPTIGAPSEHDVVALIALINALAAEPSQLFIQPIDPTNGIVLLRQHLAAIRASGGEVVLVARELGMVSGELIGLITGTRGVHPARRGVVEVGIGIRATHRGRGVGFALLTALEDWARTHACHRLHLQVATTNTPAIALYRKAAFVLEGKMKATAIVDGQHIDEIKMAKILGPCRPE